ncbi:hypothetical protein KI387_033632, partial [Taxus chinensis]
VDFYLWNSNFLQDMVLQKNACKASGYIKEHTTTKVIKSALGRGASFDPKISRHIWYPSKNIS